MAKRRDLREEVFAFVQGAELFTAQEFVASINASLKGRPDYRAQATARKPARRKQQTQPAESPKE